MKRFFILDNGGSTIKAGYSDSKVPKIIPNCVTKVKSEQRRFFIGDQIDECTDLSGLFYSLPIQKGYVVNWDVQKSIWDYVFGYEDFKMNVSETDFVVTEPYFNFRSSRQPLLEIFFEDYEVQSLFLCTPSDLAYFNFIQALKSRRYNMTIMVDSGYSFTHIVPYVNGYRVKDAIKRIDVGGKLLTNHLKEIISYRQLNVMDETYVMNQVKEDALFVSTDFKNDLKSAKDASDANDKKCDYVLPDFSTISRGYVLPRDAPNRKQVLDNHQIIRLNHERFSVPEILFHPSDIGIGQKGIPEAIISAIDSCANGNRAIFIENIVLCGGNCLFPNFSQRLFDEIRSLTPDFLDVNVCRAKNPITFSFEGGATLATKYPEFIQKKSVSKKLYDEYGVNAFLETKIHRMWSNFND